MKNQILEFVSTRHRTKEELGIYPHYLTFREISTHFGGIDRSVMRELVIEKQLEWGRTINDVWFAPKYEINNASKTIGNESEVPQISIETPKTTKDQDELINGLKMGSK